MSEPAVPSSAVLSALADQVSDLLRRVGEGAVASDASSAKGIAAALYDAERALRSAHRAIERAARAS